VDPLTLTIAVISLIIGGFGAWYTYLAYKRAHAPAFDELQRDEQSSDSIPARLLSLIWHYPEDGGNHVSWAVKESFVLRGRLEDAREEPGLGVAIVTTELALAVFRDGATSRIDGCVTWALANSLEEPPYLLKGKQFDSRTSEEKTVPDFRHSLAFGIILARTGKLKDRVSEYLRYTLHKQNADGGWPAGEGRTISEVFTVLYAIEFLSLCGLDERFPEETRSLARASRDRATEWLLSSVLDSGLWKSGVLHEYPWDDVVTTAWVLHRLAPVGGITTPHWKDGLLRASLSMISKVANPATWRGSSELQRFRAEARVAASVAAVLATGICDSNGRESLQIYLSDWRRRARTCVQNIPDADWDVGTASFVLQALFSTIEMREWVDKADLTTR
jgi:hypothetical protein